MMLMFYCKQIPLHIRRGICSFITIYPRGITKRKRKILLKRMVIFAGDLFLYMVA